MCLILLEQYHPDLQPLIAGTDITCYKVLERQPDGSLRTPYKYRQISNNNLSSDYFQNVPTRIQDKGFARNENDFYKDDFIIEKGIHSFRTLDAANTELFILSCSFHHSAFYTIKEAIIPKGTKYWIGSNNDFCSEKIIFKKPPLCV